MTLLRVLLIVAFVALFVSSYNKEYYIGKKWRRKKWTRKKRKRISRKMRAFKDGIRDFARELELEEEQRVAKEGFDHKKQKKVLLLGRGGAQNSTVPQRE